MEDNLRDMKAVYTVVDRGQGRSFWIRVGVGFTNRDGSLNLRLDAIPVNGTLQVREWEPHEKKPEMSDAPPRARAKLRDPSGEPLAEG
jgi:hypothetical protein